MKTVFHFNTNSNLKQCIEVSSVDDIKLLLTSDIHFRRWIAKMHAYKYKWTVSRQNQHNGFVTSMDPDQPVQPRRQIRVHAVRCQFLSCYRVCKRTAWILVRLRGCAGWSGSMLVANPLCCFCCGAD
jgi:hypothetical protein